MKFLRTGTLAVLLGMLTASAPVGATHPHGTDIPYSIGATVQVNEIWAGTAAPFNCWPTWQLGMGCLGGGVLQSGHGHARSATGEDEWDEGYTSMGAIGIDGVAGTNVGLGLCLKPDWSDSICRSDDPTVRGCGLFLYVDTDSHGGFRTVYAATFVRGLFVDLTTNTVCVGSTGSITGAWLG